MVMLLLVVVGVVVGDAGVAGGGVMLVVVVLVLVSVVVCMCLSHCCFDRDSSGLLVAPVHIKSLEPGLTSHDKLFEAGASSICWVHVLPSVALWSLTQCCLGQYLSCISPSPDAPQFNRECATRFEAREQLGLSRVSLIITHYHSLSLIITHYHSSPLIITLSLTCTIQLPIHYRPPYHPPCRSMHLHW